jgi:uncharacterized protein (TIGR00251 family)
MIETTVNGVIVTVRVQPRAARAGVAGTRAGALLVRLHAPPVEGAANGELIEVLAGACARPRSAVSIVSGERGRLKRVRIDGISRSEFLRRVRL